MSEDKKSQFGDSGDSESSDSPESFEIESINDEKSSESETAKELEKIKTDYLYLRAEFDNFRKNAIKERSELIKYGSERMARELLDVVDTFDLALNSNVTSENLESFVKGVQMTATNLRTLLSRFGIQEIDPLGENFDPSVHEALGTEPTSAYPPGKIARVFKKAFKMHDRMIRPAQVVVATEPIESDEDEKSGEVH